MKNFREIHRSSELQTSGTNHGRPVIDALWQRAEEAENKQKTYREQLTSAEKTFGEHALKVDRLVNWSIERPPARVVPDSIYYQRVLAERLKIDLQDHAASFRTMKEKISGEAQKISFQIDVPTEDHAQLRSEIENVSNRADREQLLQYIDKQGVDWRLDDQKKYELVKHATTQLEKIDTFAMMTEKALAEAREDHYKIEQQIPHGHLYFREEDMLPAQANIDFIPKGRLPGSCSVNVVRTLLKAQGIDVSNEEHFAQELKLDIRGGLDLSAIHHVLPSLGDKKGYSYAQVMDRENLGKALELGPIGAVLSNNTGRHVVVLDRLEMDPITSQEYVIVLDQLTTGPYKISVDVFNQAWDQHGLLPEGV